MLGDSFGPGIANITGVLNLTKPDCSKRTFGLGKIGYSSSSISFEASRQRQLFLVNSEVGQPPKLLLNKTSDLNGTITANRS